MAQGTVEFDKIFPSSMQEDMRGTAREAYSPGRPGAFKQPSRLPLESILYGAFVWARRTLNRQKRRFPARAVTDKSSTPALLKALSSKFRDKLPVAEVRAGPGSPLPKRTDRVCSQSW